MYTLCFLLHLVPWDLGPSRQNFFVASVLSVHSLIIALQNWTLVSCCKSVNSEHYRIPDYRQQKISAKSCITQQYLYQIQSYNLCWTLQFNSRVAGPGQEVSGDGSDPGDHCDHSSPRPHTVKRLQVRSVTQAQPRQAMTNHQSWSDYKQHATFLDSITRWSVSGKWSHLDT